MPMNMRTRFFLAFSVAAVALSALYVVRGTLHKEQGDRGGVERLATAKQPENAAYLGSATARPYRRVGVDPAVALAYALLNNGSSMQIALERVAGPDGAISSRELATLVQTAEGACSDVRNNAAHYLGDAQRRDPTRSWATTRLVEICHDFDASKYTFTFPADGLSRVVNEEGATRAIEASLRAVKRESDPSELYTAGQILLEKDRGTLSAILPGAGREYGDEEIMKAWALATTMLACHEAGGCGPRSLQTAAFCANTGCQPGSDFPQAVRQRLPESEYRAVNALYAWMINQRRS